MSVEPMIKQIIADPFACWKTSGLNVLCHYRLEGWIKILKIKDQTEEFTYVSPFTFLVVVGANFHGFIFLWVSEDEIFVNFKLGNHNDKWMQEFKQT